MKFRRWVETGLVLLVVSAIMACAAGSGEVVSVKTVKSESLSGLGDETLSKLEKIKNTRRTDSEDQGLKKVIQQTPNYSVEEYLAVHPDVDSPEARNYTVGGYDVLNIKIYEEADLSRKGLPVSADGYITFPLIGRLKVKDLTTTDIEARIARALAERQYLLDAHVSVIVEEYKSKNYIVLGSVEEPGAYPLQGNERVLDAISRSGGIDFEQGGKQGMIIRTEHPDTSRESKLVIRIDFSELLKGGNQRANLLLRDRDLLYIPKAENFYIIGEVQKPGSYPYLEKEITLVEAISKAGGFTQIAARNKTRIIRVENGKEIIIQVQVDAITDSGKKAQDVLVMPGDVIVIPESFF